MSFWLILLLSFFFIRYILPSLMRAALGGFVRQQVHKAQRQGGGPFGPMNSEPFGPQGPPRPAGPPPAPGQVHVDYVPPKNAKGERPTEFRGGEYVDYEEVK